jgi:hypothetical protein
MSRTVCYWCKAPLVLKDDILVCGNTDCPACDEKYLHEALIRTRKALDVAVDAIKWIHETYNLGMGYEAAIMEKCEFALEQITALEQKDVKCE